MQGRICEKRGVGGCCVDKTQEGRRNRKDWRKRESHIDQTSDMSLNGCTAQQEVDLVITVPISPQIFNAPKSGLPIRHCRIHVVLLPLFIHAEAFECQIPTWSVMRLHRSG